MDKENFLSCLGNLFVFDTFKCDCKMDKYHNTKTGEPTYSFKIKNDANSKLRYAFAPQTGLVLMKADGTPKEGNILEKFLSIKNENIDAFQKFFIEYGFLFPADYNEYSPYDWNTLLSIIRKLKNTVSLMSEVHTPPLNYANIVSKVFYLIFNETVPIKLKNTSKTYSSCNHNIQLIINNADLAHENSLHFIKDDAGDYYLIPDTVSGKDERIDYSVYRQIINPGLIANDYTAKVTALYANYFIDEESRLLIDFLYNFNKKIATFSGLNSDGNPVFGTAISNINSSNNEDIKAALVSTAKIIIRDEINNALQAVSPNYNINTMTGAWSIPHFLTAMYFSLFYMQSDLEVFRRCGNPNCECFFTVKTTNLKRKYCSNLCRGAVNQQRHRLKKKNR